MLTLVAILLTATACSGESLDQVANQKEPLPTMNQNVNTGITQSPNRYFAGAGSVTEPPRQISLDTDGQSINWVVGAAKDASGDQPINWAVVRDDGRWMTVGERELDVERADWSGQLFESSQPPVVGLDEKGEVRLLSGASALDLRTESAEVLRQIENNPDAAAVIDANGNIYSYTNPTDRYPHGALGDDTEWASLTTVDDGESFAFHLPEDEVFEGLFPLITDVDNDGEPEVLTTVSEPSGGARLMVLKRSEGELKIVAESPTVGTGFRWMHQIAVAPFGPNGETEIAAVRTPHIGGIAQFYRMTDGELSLVASESGEYMSHVIRSRNLDQGVAGDFDGDGNVELVVPSRDQMSLIGLRRVNDGIEEVWSLELESRLSSNLAAVSLNDGGLVLAVGTENGTLYVWR